jgi:8-oxo-dGTP diphosphatase
MRGLTPPILAEVGELAAWRFCPRCASGLAGTGARLECSRCGFVVYASSKPTASAIVIGGDGRVLLARRKFEPSANLWDLPGGFLEEGEHPLDAVRRELREEADVEVEPGRFIGVWMDRYGEDDDDPATINLYWTARLTAGDPEPADDVAELRWFARDALPPPDELAFHTAEVLSAWRDEQP